jgi:hypothetical protein
MNAIHDGIWVRRKALAFCRGFFFADYVHSSLGTWRHTNDIVDTVLERLLGE